MENQSSLLAQIPPSFHSFESGDLFTHCLECKRHLLEEDCEYVIEKAVRNYTGFPAKDVIFDCAICMDCVMEIQAGLSEESTQAIQKFMKEKVDVAFRVELANEGISNVEVFTNQCMISKRRMSDCAEYQIFAVCKGNKIDLKMPPYMLSGEVLEEISELLSEKTRDDLNGFFNKHFSPDPSLLEPIPRLILI